MDDNEYTLQLMVHERLADMRRQAERRALLPRRQGPSLRAQVGLALIALGRVLAGPWAPAIRQEPTRG